VKKYTHDKNIVEIIVDKEDGMHILDTHINALMELCMGFLKQAKLISPQTVAKYVNKMTVINMQDDVRTKQAQGAVSNDFVGAVFTRTSVLISLCHAKKLLATHGYESFTEYITGFFDLTKKDKKNIPFLKHLKEQQQYKTFDTYLTESRSASNHPKLRKLAEILITFFSDP